jgi:hypothetical protein
MHRPGVLWHFDRHCPRASRCGSLLEGLSSLRFELRMEHDGHGDLCSSGHQIVTPYIHRRCVCIAMCCLKRVWSESALARSFYSSWPDNYIETRDPTGGTEVVETLLSYLVFIPKSNTHCMYDPRSIVSHIQTKSVHRLPNVTNKV